jgi:hypothetical protein
MPEMTHASSFSSIFDSFADGGAKSILKARRLQALEVASSERSKGARWVSWAKKEGNIMRALGPLGAGSVALLLFSNSAMAQVRFEEYPRAICAASHLVVSYGIGGLGNRLTVDVFTSADVTLECVRAGRTISAETLRMTTPATHPVDRTGEARGSVFLRPFNPCTGSDRLIATYRGVAVEAGNQEAIAVLPGTLVCRP